MTAASRRSSAFASAALVLALAPAGCGDSERLEDSRAYLEQANAIQRQAAPALRRANRAYVQFSGRRLSDEQAVQRLEAAEKSVRSTRARLARLDPPADAAKLHRLLLELYDANADFAHETTLLGEYLPAAEEALTPLRRANRGLREGLSGAEGSPGRQASALRRYGRRLDAILRRLRALEPPPILARAHRSQRLRLEETSRLVAQLGTALERQEAKRVARLLLRFRRLQGGNAGPALNRESIGAYNRRYRALTRRAADAQRERAALEKRLRED